MASTSGWSIEDPKLQLQKEIRSREVAIAELSCLSSSRKVYQKNGTIFFRTSIDLALTSEKKQLDLAKSKLEKTNPT
ncbi:unnamed protein product [Victoria cruziana]